MYLLFEEFNDGINSLFLIKKQNKEILRICKTRHMIKILRIQRNFRKRKIQPKKINFRRFKSLFIAVLKGWRIRRIFATLKNDENIREAIDIIKLNEDTKNRGNNYFKQFIDKFPEMMQLFHSSFNELMDHKGWFGKPIAKVKILPNKHVLKSKRFDIKNMKKHKSKELSAKPQMNDNICEDSTSSKNILTKDNKSKVVIESKKLKAPVKTTQNKNSIPSSKIHRKY